MINLLYLQYNGSDEDISECQIDAQPLNEGDSSAASGTIITMRLTITKPFGQRMQLDSPDASQNIADVYRDLKERHDQVYQFGDAVFRVMEYSQLSISGRYYYRDGFILFRRIFSSTGPEEFETMQSKICWTMMQVLHIAASDYVTDFHNCFIQFNVNDIVDHVTGTPFASVQLELHLILNHTTITTNHHTRHDLVSKLTEVYHQFKLPISQGYYFEDGVGFQLTCILSLSAFRVQTSNLPNNNLND
ncbi:unnamed protein product [Echinostoma caproni]|uniref:FERM domain-containing protein n=1 Tax=Echinostoma caproni TaxID=27848 RepID=A0A183AGK1_9TREM|nr:unnamed protein product [Echinostoma caproni]